MKAGKFAGKTLREVPFSYLVWLAARDTTAEHLLGRLSDEVVWRLEHPRYQPPRRVPDRN